MSSPVSALGGTIYTGFVEISDAGLQGMITLRGDLASAAMKKAVKAATGTAIPAPRRIVGKEDRAAAWLSPDELLLLLPHAEAAATVAALGKALEGHHHLAADVSDARAMLRIRGARATEVLMKLCPVDFRALARDEVRRTRAAQVAAAFWQTDPAAITLVTFRSSARYLMDLLQTAAQPGSELFPA